MRSARRQGSEPRALQLSPFTHQMLLWVYSSRDQWREHRDNIYGHVIHGWPSTTGKSGCTTLPLPPPTYQYVYLFWIRISISYSSYTYTYTYYMYTSCIYNMYIFIKYVIYTNTHMLRTDPFLPIWTREDTLRRWTYTYEPERTSSSVNTCSTWTQTRTPSMDTHVLGYPHLNPRGHLRTTNTYMTQERTPSIGEHMPHMINTWSMEPQTRTPSIEAHVLGYPIWTREDTLERWTHIWPKRGHRLRGCEGRRRDRKQIDVSLILI